MKRFTISLAPAEYAELKRIARAHRPPLTLQYVVRFALQRFIEENKGKPLALDVN